MSQYILGEILHKLRKNNKYTQAYISEVTGYSLKQLRRIEQDKSSPSIDLVHKLSVLYNKDLFIYYKQSELIDPYRASKEYIALNEAYKSFDKSKLINLIEELKDNPLFEKGEPAQTLIYMSLTSTRVPKHEYPSRIKVCLEALKLDCPTLTKYHFRNYSFQNTSYNIINHLCLCYYFSGSPDKCHELLLDTIHNIKVNFFENKLVALNGDRYDKQVYFIFHCTLMNYYIEEKLYEKAYQVNVELLDFIQKNDYYKFLPEIYLYRYLIHIEQEQVETAIEELKTAVTLSNLIDNPYVKKRVRIFMDSDKEKINLTYREKDNNTIEIIPISNETPPLS